MSFIQEGVNRSTLYPPFCESCQAASKALMDAQKETGSANIEVSCRSLVKRKGILLRKSTNIIMTTRATFADNKSPQHLEVINEIFESDASVAQIGKIFYETNDVTDVCNGLRNSR